MVNLPGVKMVPVSSSLAFCKQQCANGMLRHEHESVMPMRVICQLGLFSLCFLVGLCLCLPYTVPQHRAQAEDSLITCDQLSRCYNILAFPCVCLYTLEC